MASNLRPWFYTKPCNRELATELLNACGGHDGLFIVRESSIIGAVAVSCVQGSEVLHHLLEFGALGRGNTRQCILNDQIISESIASLEDAIHFLARPHQTALFLWQHPLRLYIDAESAEKAVEKYGLPLPSNVLMTRPLQPRINDLMERPSSSHSPRRTLLESDSSSTTAANLVLSADALARMSRSGLIDHILKLQAALMVAETGDGPTPTGSAPDWSPVTAPPRSGFASEHQEEQYSKIEWEIPWDSIEIGNKVGQGSYGVVYRGKWHGDVAVKKLLVEDPTPDQLALFKNEVLVLRKTRHRNVLLFMGACTILPNLAIVTQWAEGGSLQDKLHDVEVSLPNAHKVDIACQIAQGMEYLHSKQIVHRDLKSGNILIDNEIDYEQGSSPPQIRVADFGLAMMKKAFTADGSTLGSIFWMAPEIINQSVEEPYTEYSDSYAFGIVLYEMWAEALPYRGLDGMSILYMVGRGLVEPDLEQLGDNTPPRIREILIECISREREERPTFADSAARCNKLLKKLPSLARAGSVSAIHGGRGKVSPIKWTPRPLSVRHHRMSESGTATPSASPRTPNLSILTESGAGGIRRTQSSYGTTVESATGAGVEIPYDNVQRLDTGGLKISDGPE
eukprot:m.189138 g.189138  ORF g.189138 m.189138 type:complete len:624 (+) comp17656_c0_seq1:265-2136(+)